MVRRLKRSFGEASLPIPGAVVKPFLWTYLGTRAAVRFGVRMAVCQPFLRAQCERCGPGLRTGESIHEVRGPGDIILGAHVFFDGKSSITFAARFSARPTLEIGDSTNVGDGTTFAIGKRITIGKRCQISGATRIFDSSGHPVDPAARARGEPPASDEVRPIEIGDDVWIGKNCIIFPGVRIGDGAVVSAGSIVHRHVPAHTVVAGNPARVMFKISAP